MMSQLLTGLDNFDKYTGGIVEGKLNLISGRSGTGKSYLLEGILNGIANNDKKCLYLTYEPHRIVFIKNVTTICHNIFSSTTLIALIKTLMEQESFDVICVDDIFSMSSDYKGDRKHLDELYGIGCTIIASHSSYHTFDGECKGNNYPTYVSALIVVTEEIIPFNADEKQFISTVKVVKSRYAAKNTFYQSLDLSEKE